METAAGPVSYDGVGPGDIPELAELTARSFDGYRAFASEGWRPPDVATLREMLERWHRIPGFWGRLARSADGSLAGHVTFVPASRHRRFPVEDPRLAHLSDLFLVPERWGTGLASELLSQAVAEAGARGLTAVRLYVAEGQLRARRFYEREGFAQVGGPMDVGLGLPSLEYRREPA